MARRSLCIDCREGERILLSIESLIVAVDLNDAHRGKRRRKNTTVAVPVAAAGGCQNVGINKIVIHWEAVPNLQRF